MRKRLWSRLVIKRWGWLSLKRPHRNLIIENRDESKRLGDKAEYVLPVFPNPSQNKKHLLFLAD